MTGPPILGGHDLAGQQIQLRKFIVYPAAAVDTFEGSPIPGPFTHHIRIVLPTEGEGLLLPCDRQFLTSLNRQLTELLQKEGVSQDGKD